MKVINLPKSSSRSYSDILEISFRELREYWITKLLSLSTATETEPQAELSMPPQALGRLAFFSVPTRHAALYKALFYPIAERYGFSPIMAADVIAPGDTLMAKVYALIEKSAVVIADLSSPNTLLEVGMVLSKEHTKKHLILVAEELASVPFDVANYKVILRPKVLDEAPKNFIDLIEKAFSGISTEITPALEEEPSRLLAKREYRAAVISAFTLLEHELRQTLDGLKVDSFASRYSIGRLLELAASLQVITHNEYESTREHMRIRNRLVHTREEIQANTSRKLVKDLTSVAIKLREKNLTIRSESTTT